MCVADSMPAKAETQAEERDRVLRLLADEKDEALRAAFEKSRKGDDCDAAFYTTYAASVQQIMDLIEAMPVAANA